MPTEQERPGMFAPRNDRGIVNRPNEAQPLVRGTEAQQHRRQRYHRSQRQYHPNQLQVAARQPQGQYQAWVPAPVRPLSFEPITPLNNVHLTSAVQPSHVVQRTTLQQSRTARRARRTSRMVNGVIYTGSAVPLPTEAPSQYPSDNATREVEQERASSYFVGCQPYYPNPPVTSHHDCRQQRPPPEPSSRQRPRLLAPPPANVPHRHSPVSRPPPSGLPRTHLDKDLPSLPYAPEVQPPDGETRGVPIDHQVTNPEHRELHFGGQVPGALLPAELEGNQPAELEGSRPAELEGSEPALAIFQPTPNHLTRQNTTSFLIRYGGMQHPAELDAGTDAQEEQEHLGHPAESQQEPPVLPEIAFDTSLSMFDRRQSPVATWYEFYRGARTWEFEDLEEAYGRMVDGSDGGESGLRGRRG